MASSQTTSPGIKPATEVEKTTEASLIRSTTEKSIADKDKARATPSGKLGENDESDLATDKDMTVDGLCK